MCQTWVTFQKHCSVQRKLVSSNCVWWNHPKDNDETCLQICTVDSVNHPNSKFWHLRYQSVHLCEYCFTNPLVCSTDAYFLKAIMNHRFVLEKNWYHMLLEGGWSAHMVCLNADVLNTSGCSVTRMMGDAASLFVNMMAATACNVFTTI